MTQDKLIKTVKVDILPIGNNEYCKVGDKVCCYSYKKFAVGIITDLRIATYECAPHETWNINQLKIRPLVSYEFRISKHKEDWFNTGICDKLSDSDITNIKNSIKEVYNIMETL